MSSTSNPEARIVEALVYRLTEVTSTVLLGYSALGLNDELPTPAMLVQLESIQEQGRQGSRRKMSMALNVSVVIKTDEDSTYTLMDLTRLVRELFASSERFTPEARTVQFSETQFDIAPNHGHLSFADIQLTIDVIL
ncbi:hypothetical protein [uncultured Endozoicomonas sp.]|uniref:hypothetical protein n=1 Tax=uncultured Endozoicomonas sp. TaxID=432652 RepID=UPI002607DE36|nr:hypothetical protein [uncultured Endozoicomonas sp.]